MSRRVYCQACSMNRFGATTRLECTCGKNIQRKKAQPYEPTREEVEKYIARLKDFWDEENQCWLKDEKKVSLESSNITALQAKKLSNENDSSKI